MRTMLFFRFCCPVLAAHVPKLQPLGARVVAAVFATSLDAVDAELDCPLDGGSGGLTTTAAHFGGDDAVEVEVCAHLPVRAHLLLQVGAILLTTEKGDGDTTIDLGLCSVREIVWASNPSLMTWTLRESKHTRTTATHMRYVFA